MNIKKKVIIIIPILLIVSILAVVVLASGNKYEQEEELDDENTVNKVNTEPVLDLEPEDENINTNMIDDETENISEENNVNDEKTKKEETQEKVNQNKKDDIDDKKIQESTNTKQTIKKEIEGKKEVKESNKELNNKEDKEKQEDIQKQEVTEKQENSKKIDLSKYDYYKNGLNGSYIAFLEEQSEIDKLKSLIDEALAKFGYKNMKIVLDKSLSKDGTMYFTANKTNVQNAVYNSEGFSIYYYAIKEYHILANGEESYFQTRSYIKVK